MNRIKQVIKQLLGRRKVRLLLTFILALPSWVIVRASGVFDRDWYIRQYAGDRNEVVKKQFPLMHYLLLGRQKGLSPSPFFIGEYYDPWRWHNSIQDPLIKYITRVSTWSRPTSILFDGRFHQSHSKFLPPLIQYLRQLKRQGDVKVYYDAQFAAARKVMWSDISQSIYNDVDQRTEQYSFRKVAQPSSKFDTEKEADAIAAYRNYFKNAEQPLVSIITPVWNREELIKAAIESVQAQTYENWELLIVDDGSTDSTVDVVREYGEKDSRVKVFTPLHGGVCKARNHGIEHANGEWVAFLDSDNAWTSDFLMTSVGMLLDSTGDASYSAIKMDSNGHVRYRTTEPNLKLLETGNFIDLNALIVRKKILDDIGYFDESLRRMVDYDLVIRLSKVSKIIYVPVVGVNYTDHEDLERISTTESLSWDGVVKNKNFINWEANTDTADNKKTSIIVPVRGAINHAVRCLKSIIATVDGDDDVEIIVVDASSSSAMNIAMSSIATIDNRVKYYRESASRDAVLATNYGFARAVGSRVVVVNQHIIVEGDWLSGLVSPLGDNCLIGPLQLKPSRTVLSAGVEFHGEQSLPVNILADHPTSDISGLDEVYATEALMTGCFAIDASLFARLHGLNPLYDKGFESYDLCLRAKEMDSDVRVKIAKSSQIVNSDEGRGWYGVGQKQYMSDWSGKAPSKTSRVWEKAGFIVEEYEPNYPEYGNESSVTPRLRVKDKKTGTYRWAIKISAPSDDRRFAWGDLYYAQSLAKSLERLNQKVAIDFHDYHYRRTSYLDDINLDLRGLDDFKPQLGKVNIMWVISHPEKVTPAMIKSFDKVYSAGSKWSEYMSSEADVYVEFMPQCTDTDIFHPPEKPNKEFTGKTLFVGNSRNVLRPIVKDAIEAGLDVAVYGGGWDGLIDSKYIKGTFIPNDKLHEAYGSASVVLNDHWKDMREWGFLSNRLFDASASGARIITDDVEGIINVFTSDIVQVYKSTTNLRHIHDTWENEDLSGDNKQSNYEMIKGQHSFHARARELVDYIDEAQEKLN